MRYPLLLALGLVVAPVTDAAAQPSEAPGYVDLALLDDAAAELDRADRALRALLLTAERDEGDCYRAFSGERFAAMDRPAQDLAAALMGARASLRPTLDALAGATDALPAPKLRALLLTLPRVVGLQAHHDALLAVAQGRSLRYQTKVPTPGNERRRAMVGPTQPSRRPTLALKAAAAAPAADALLEAGRREEGLPGRGLPAPGLPRQPGPLRAAPGHRRLEPGPPRALGEAERGALTSRPAGSTRSSFTFHCITTR